MKTKLLINVLGALALVIFPLLSGCSQRAQSASISPSLIETAAPTHDSSPEKISALNEVATLEPATTAKETPAKPEQVESAPADLPQNTLPAAFTPNAELAEFIKLAQAGVDETVMFAYITNSSHLFGLDAEGIVYLNDLGVSGEVITAMMQHDQEMKNFWANQAAPVPPASSATAATATQPDETASAPTYVFPPEQPAQTTEQPVVVNNNYFYESLAPYGSWVVVEGYGRCWRPTVCARNSNWRPYCDGGRWVYTDCGWYWYSDYSWGWAPFHYGRWFNHPRNGWCWAPDTVWSPAWVSWRYTDNHCGWAPAAPTSFASVGFGWSWDNFTFVSWNNFCHKQIDRHCEPRSHTQDYFKKSIPAKDLKPEQVAALSKSEIRPIHIREGARGRDGRRERIEPDGRTLIVQRGKPAQQNDGAPVAGGAAKPTTPSVADNTRVPETSPSNRADNRGHGRNRDLDKNKPVDPHSPDRSRLPVNASANGPGRKPVTLAETSVPSPTENEPVATTPPATSTPDSTTPSTSPSIGRRTPNNENIGNRPRDNRNPDNIPGDSRSRDRNKPVNVTPTPVVPIAKNPTTTTPNPTTTVPPLNGRSPVNENIGNRTRPNSTPMPVQTTRTPIIINSRPQSQPVTPIANARNVPQPQQPQGDIRARSPQPVYSVPAQNNTPVTIQRSTPQSIQQPARNYTVTAPVVNATRAPVIQTTPAPVAAAQTAPASQPAAQPATTRGNNQNQNSGSNPGNISRP